MNENSLLHAVLDILEDGVCLLDGDGQVRAVNAAALALLGRPDTDLLGRGALDALAAEDFKPCLQGALAGERERRDETGFLVGGDGIDLPVFYSLAPVRVDGQPAGALLRFHKTTPAPLCVAALQDSETKLGAILDTVADGVVAVDESGIIRVFNPASELLFGYRSEEVLGLNVNVLMPSPDREAHDGYIAHYLRTGIKNIIGIGREVSGRRKDGSVFPLHLTIGEARLSGGRLFVAVLHDLTARKRAEEKLLTLSRVVEQTPNAVMMVNLGGIIEYVNPSFTRLTGYTSAEAIGKTPALLRSPHTSPEQYQRLRQTLLAGGEWREEIQDRKKNGELYWALEIISPMRNAAGSITHFLAIQQNITEQKRALEALRVSEERFRQVAEMSGEWLWEQDAQGRYSYCSGAVRQILGYAPEEIIGMPYLNLLTDEDKKHWTADLPPTQEVHEPFFRLVNRYRHKDGHEVFTESTGEPIFGADGKPVKWRGVDHDITARRHYETERRRAEEERHELEIAKQIQLSLLPKSALKQQDFEVAGICLPATHVGGDYFDYFYSNDTLNIVIADVSGHSVGAALLMAGVRSTLKAEARKADPSRPDQGAADILLALNELLHEDLNGSDLFISMFYLRYNPKLRQLCYANAGHNLPLLWREGEAACWELDTEGMVLGVGKKVIFEEKCLRLQAGDKLLLYTDGITEAQNPAGEFFGVGRLCELFAGQKQESPETAIANILEALRGFCGSQSFQDDVSMVVLRVD